MVKNFHELIIWEKATDFYKELILILPSFPKGERDCLIPQIRRASLSISNNIAEGCGRGSNQNLKYFLLIAFGSAKEVENMLFLSKKLSYIDEDVLNKLNFKIQEIEKMLFSFIKNLGIKEN